MAKREFRNWEPKGTIRIKYRDETGNPNLWEADQWELLNNISAIIGSYMSQKIKLTSRQLYYQLVAGGIIPNAVETYKRVCSFLTDARYGGFVDWEVIEDRGRVPEKHAEWEDINALLRSARYSYRLPRWADQEFYIELYCEKQAMESILKPIADKYHIYFGYNKGYSSASMMYDLAQRFDDQVENNKRGVIVYLGDHDPSGLDMVRDIKSRLTEFIWPAAAGGDYLDLYNDMDKEGTFKVEQIALTMDQIKQYKPPPNPAKITDPRAKGYVAKYGKVSWELDSLKPDVLVRLVESTILNYIDIDKYTAIIKREQRELNKLVKFAKTLPKRKK